MDTTIVEEPFSDQTPLVVDPGIQPGIQLAKASEENLEKTPEFESWKNSKLREWSQYLKSNWNITVSPEKLVLLEQGGGFPDPGNRKAYAMIGSNNNYILPGSSVVAVNPATGRNMTYSLWRPLLATE
jgi:hypothetical protein